MTPRFDKIIAGRPDWEARGFLHYPQIDKQIHCADGNTISVQASRTHYCSPRNNWGPYRSVEVGYPSTSPPDSWKEYFEGDWDTDDHTASVYAGVPVALVREFIEAHGGEE